MTRAHLTITNALQTVSQAQLSLHAIPLSTTHLTCPIEEPFL
jgi:hypothetical protein